MGSPTLRFLCSLAAAVAVSSSAYASIEYTVLDAPVVPGTRGTILSGINDLGEIVGYYNFNTTGSSGNEARSVVWDSDRNPTIFSVAGSARTLAFGINNAGQTVGIYLDGSTNRDRGFLRNADGTHVSIDIPGAIETIAAGINNNGQVSGYYTFDVSGIVHTQAFIRALDGAYEFFDAPGAFQTNSWGIDDASRVVGYYETMSASGNGFLRYPDDTFDPVSVSSYSTGTLPNDINNLGQVIGTNGQTTFALDVLGSYFVFSKPGSIVTVAAGLNDGGTIVGSFVNPDDGDISHGFIATGVFGSGGNGVVPELSALAIWSVLSLVGFCIRPMTRRKGS